MVTCKDENDLEGWHEVRNKLWGREAGGRGFDRLLLLPPFLILPPPFLPLPPPVLILPPPFLLLLLPPILILSPAFLLLLPSLLPLLHPILLILLIIIFYFPPLLNLLVFFLKHYSLFWTLAANTISLHSRRPLTIACLFLIPITFKPSSYSYLRLLRGLPIFLLPSTVSVAICFGILWFCILSTWPKHLSRRDSPCNMSFISLFVFIVQQSPSFTGSGLWC